MKVSQAQVNSESLIWLAFAHTRVVLARVPRVEEGQCFHFGDWESSAGLVVLDERGYRWARCAVPHDRDLLYWRQCRGGNRYEWENVRIDLSLELDKAMR